MHLFFYSSGFVIIILDLKRCLGIIQVDADSGFFVQHPHSFSFLDFVKTMSVSCGL
jgi:hypothetical protein